MTTWNSRIHSHDNVVTVVSTWNFQLSSCYSVMSDSLPFERLWTMLVAKPYVVFAYFKLKYESNLVQKMTPESFLFPVHEAPIWSCQLTLGKSTISKFGYLNICSYSFKGIFVFLCFIHNGFSIQFIQSQFQKQICRKKQQNMFKTNHKNKPTPTPKPKQSLSLQVEIIKTSFKSPWTGTETIKQWNLNIIQWITIHCLRFLFYIKYSWVHGKLQFFKGVVVD